MSVAVGGHGLADSEVKAQRRRAISVVTVLTLVATLYVAVPLGLQARTEYAKIANRNRVPQHHVPVPTLPGDDNVVVSSLRAQWDASSYKGPVILTYHDLEPKSPSLYTVTPNGFAEQMQALDALGVHTLTSQEFVAWINGHPVPPRSVMITFDDGARGVWKYADGVLAQHGFHAVAFIISGFVGTRAPYYMTWDELSTLDKSGRWDFESHTYLGHVRIPTDAAGHIGSFLGHQQWLPDLGRVETPTEYETRIRFDLTTSVRQLHQRGFAKAGLFAFPYSDSGTTDDDASATLIATTRGMFTALFADDVRPHAIGGKFVYNRLDVDSEVTTSTMLKSMGEVIRLDAAPDATLPAR